MFYENYKLRYWVKLVLENGGENKFMGTHLKCEKV